MSYELHHGDCLEVMKSLPDNSVDAVVTDPPYGLSFMGKKWDYDVPSVEIWKEALRVLKPGGHLLSFGGTRTYHRMVVNIEDAGFEIRDQIQWIYGSGFPKSLDVSKAIDKQAGAEREVIGKKLHARDGDVSHQAWTQHGTSCKQYVNGGQTRGVGMITAPATESAKQWEGWGTALKPANEIVCLARKPQINTDDCAIMALEVIKKICQSPLLAKIVKSSSMLSQSGLGEVADIARWIADANTNTSDALNALTDILRFESETNTNLSTALLWLDILDAIYCQASTFTTEMKSSLITDLKILNSLPLMTTLEHTIKGETNLNGDATNAWRAVSIFNAVHTKLDYTLERSAQDLATSLESETNLRPNSTPICLARKPLIGTVAENVKTHGTGAINIDGCRVATTESLKGGQYSGTERNHGNCYGKHKNLSPSQYTQPRGRFPANVIHDGSEEVVGLFPQTTSGKMTGKQGGFGNSSLVFGGNSETPDAISYADSGSAARFFYCAKASKADRNAGLEGFEERETYSESTATPMRDHREQVKRANHHPTVKPTELMRYLCRLITPPNGTVLDPFAGSGSTGKAAILEGFSFIGIEREEEYAEIARARIAHVSGGLFA